LTEAGDYQNDDGNYIRQRLENFLHASSQSGDVQIQDVESAEKESSPYSVQRFPQSEDYKGNRKPSSVAEAVIRPGSAGVLHNKVQTAQTRKACADAGGKIFILRNVDSRRVRGRRAFSDRAEIQSVSGAEQENGKHHCSNDAQVSHKTIAEEKVSQHGNLR